MNDLNSKLYSSYLSLLGYRKIPLRDTKGVLDESNNFKYYKESMLHYKSKTILPSGTKITFQLDDMDKFSKADAIKETLTIKKSSGDIIKSVIELGKPERKIFKNGKLLAVLRKK